MQTSAKQIEAKYPELRITPMFGQFWNFCINAPVHSEEIHNVFCNPHVNAFNCSLFVCAVLVYSYGECKLTIVPYLALSHANSTMYTTPMRGKNMVGNLGGWSSV